MVTVIDIVSSLPTLPTMGRLAAPFLCSYAASSSSPTTAASSSPTRFLLSTVASLSGCNLIRRTYPPSFFQSLHTLANGVDLPQRRTLGFRVSINCVAQKQPQSEGRSSAASRSPPRVIPVLERDEKTGEIYVKGPGSSASVSVENGEAEGKKKVKVPAARISTGVKKSGALPRYTKAARRFYNEKFRAEPERLSKVLAAAGVASRRGSEDIIFAGRVKVNGKVCSVPQTPVDPLKDVIFLDGRSLPKKLPPRLYFALNKPKGYICSSAADGPKPVLSLFDDYWKIWEQRNVGMSRPRLFTVGRLDVATSGLLLVTNDGDFAQRVSHPSTGLTKEYVATVSERVTKRQLQLIADGTMVQGVRCVPTEVELLASELGDSRHRLRIVVCEGRNHEVREIVANSGLEIVGLKRVRVGGLALSRKLRRTSYMPTKFMKPFGAGLGWEGPGKYEVLTETQVNKVLDGQTQRA